MLILYRLQEFVDTFDEKLFSDCPPPASSPLLQTPPHIEDYTTGNEQSEM